MLRLRLLGLQHRIGRRRWWARHVH
jgi:hypothetical protein